MERSIRQGFVSVHLFGAGFIDWSREIQSWVRTLLRNAVTETRRHFRSPEEEERPPLEAVTRRLIKTQLTVKTLMCFIVNCRLHTRELLGLFVVPRYKLPINPDTHANPSHNIPYT
jgi:hypothetical protein